MGLITFVISLVAVLLTVIAFLPVLGILNWIFVPLSILSLVANIVARFIGVGFRSLAKAGVWISIIAILIGFWRLHLGNGVF